MRLSPMNFVVAGAVFAIPAVASGHDVSHHPSMSRQGGSVATSLPASLGFGQGSSYNITKSTSTELDFSGTTSSGMYRSGEVTTNSYINLTQVSFNPNPWPLPTGGVRQPSAPINFGPQGSGGGIASLPASLGFGPRDSYNINQSSSLYVTFDGVVGGGGNSGSYRGGTIMLNKSIELEQFPLYFGGKG